MRRLLLIDAVLLVLLALLSAANRHFDRKALMGSHARWDKIEGQRLEDVIVGQPVIPDEIYLYPFERICRRKIRLKYYKADNCLFRYPYIVLHATDERVLLAEIDSPESPRSRYIKLSDDEDCP